MTDKELFVMTANKIDPRYSDPDKCMTLAGETIEKNPEWKTQYEGMFLAVHGDLLIATADEMNELLSWLMEKQSEIGRFRCYIFQAGAEEIVSCKGNKIKLSKQSIKPKNF
jgi:hypothetical protein